MNSVLDEILSTKRVLTRDGSSVALDSSISVAEGMALRRLIRATRPRVTLEIGFAYGISTLFICEALAEVGGERHIVIDPLQVEGWHGIGLFTLERAGYSSLLEFHGAPSHQALPLLDQAGRRVDLALIDGWHTFDYVMVDFFYVDRLLNAGGILMLDDAASYPAIRKLARYVVTHRQYQPLANESPGHVPARQRAFDAMTSAFRLPPLKPVMRRIARPEILQPDRELGLPPDNFVAFRKTADDRLGDGSGGTRKWDQHFDF